MTVVRFLRLRTPPLRIIFRPSSPPLSSSSTLLTSRNRSILFAFGYHLWLGFTITTSFLHFLFSWVPFLGVYPFCCLGPFSKEKGKVLFHTKATTGLPYRGRVITSLTPFSPSDRITARVFPPLSPDTPLTLFTRFPWLLFHIRLAFYGLICVLLSILMAAWTKMGGCLCYMLLG